MTVLRLPLIAALTLVPFTVAAEEVPSSVLTAASCAPVGTAAPAQAAKVSALTTTGRTALDQTMFTVGQRVKLDRGTDEGVQTGQRYMVRRPMRFFGAPRAEYTIGWLHVTDATTTSATAEVDFTCDAMVAGDHVEPFAPIDLPEGVTRTFTGGTLDPQRAMRVSYGNDGRFMQGDRDFVLADQGRAHGVAVGARYAAFRRSADPERVPAIAEAVVVSVFEDQALLRITAAREQLFAGDRFVHRAGAIDPLVVGSEPAAPAFTPDGTLRPTGVGPSSSPSSGGGSAAAGDPPATRPAERRVTFEDVYFALDRHSLRPEARKLLDEAVRALKADPALRVQVEGHTCNIGTAEYNLMLGQRRAETVRDYLLKSGVATDRVTTLSYGEEKPMHDNSDAKGRRLNRRAVLVVNIQR